MSPRKRTFGVGFFATLFIVGNLVTVLFWTFPIFLYLSKPAAILESIRLYWKSAPIQTLVMLYENTMTFAYLFVGFGLWRLKFWAYRLLLLLLWVRTGESAVLAAQAAMSGNYEALGGFVGGAVIFILIFFFFRRDSIREQFLPEIQLPVSEGGLGGAVR